MVKISRAVRAGETFAVYKYLKEGRGILKINL